MTMDLTRLANLGEFSSGVAAISTPTPLHRQPAKALPIVRLLIGITLLMGIAVPAEADGHRAGRKPKLETLLSGELEGAPGTEVIVSRVEIPANVSLPKHWHPGEEFAYVLEGSVTIWQEGKEDTIISAGQVGKIPLAQIHTAITGDEGVTLLVFRVHEKGKPERVPAE